MVGAVVDSSRGDSITEPLATSFDLGKLASAGVGGGPSTPFAASVLSNPTGARPTAFSISNSEF